MDAALASSRWQRAMANTRQRECGAKPASGSAAGRDHRFSLVDFTPVPCCRGTRLGTCRLSSRLQGVGRPLSARPCPWPELAADSVRVSFPRLPGKHLPPRGSTTRSCIPRHRDSGVSAGCEIAATRAYASPCLARILPSAPFELADPSTQRSGRDRRIDAWRHGSRPHKAAKFRVSAFCSQVSDDWK